MKRLLIGACLIVACVWGGRVAMAQTDAIVMSDDGLTVVWQHDELGGTGISGDWNTADQWYRGNLSYNKHVPTQHYNALISGFNTPVNITITQPAAANRVLLYTSNDTGAGAGLLTLDIGADASFASLETYTYGTDGQGIKINHTSGTVNIKGSNWSAAQGTPVSGFSITPSAPSVLSSGASIGVLDNSTSTWQVWPYIEKVENSSVVVAWAYELTAANASKNFPLYIDGWDGSYVYDDFSPELKSYLSTWYPENTGEDAYAAWCEMYHNGQNPNLLIKVWDDDEYEFTKAEWDTTKGLYNANTPEKFKRNNPLLPTTSELDADADLQSGPFDYVLFDKFESNIAGDDTSLVLFSRDPNAPWGVEGQDDTYLQFGYLALDAWDGDDDDDDENPDPTAPEPNDTPTSAVLRLGVTGSSSSQKDAHQSTYTLGGGAGNPVLKADGIEITGNGRNTFEAEGGVLEVDWIRFKKDSETVDEKDMTFYNDGTEIRFVGEKPAGEVGKLLTVAGNYSGVGRSRNEGVLSMRAYSPHRDNDNLVYLKADGNLIPESAIGNDMGASYVLFDSDLLQVTVAEDSAGITGDLITGGTLMLDVSAIASYYDLFHDAEGNALNAGVALKLFDAEGTITKGTGTDGTWFHNVELAGDGSSENPLLQLLGDSLVGLDASGDAFVYALDNQILMGEGYFLLGWGAAPQGGGGDGDGVPEPSTVVLLLLGVAGLYVARKRRVA